MIVNYDCNDNTIVIYNRNDSGKYNKYYKTIEFTILAKDSHSQGRKGTVQTEE